MPPSLSEDHALKYSSLQNLHSGRACPDDGELLMSYRFIYIEDGTLRLRNYGPHNLFLKEKDPR